MNKRYKEKNSRVIDFVMKFAPLNALPGEWQSTVPGEGFDLFQIRPYIFGDDATKIHLPSLIKEGEYRVIDRVAQTQVNVYLYADFSHSMTRNENLHFFSKAEIRDVVVGLLCFSAAKIYSPLSLCAFSDRARYSSPPVIGDDNAQRIFRWALECEGFEGATNLKSALQHIMRFAKSRSLVFFISDFMDELDFLSELKKVTSRFDFVAVVIQSNFEKKLISSSRSACLTVSDSESKIVEDLYLDTRKKESMRQAWEDHFRELRAILKSANAQWIFADSPDVCLRRLQKLFARRR